MENATMQNSNIKRVDATRLQWNLVVSLLFFATCFTAFFALKSGNILLMAGLLALPFVLILMGKPMLVFSSAIVIDAAGYNIPGVNLTSTGMVARLLLIGVFFLGSMMGTRGWKGESVAEKKPLKLFAAIILILMVYRGSGLRLLGSETWGGMIYVNLLVGIVFFFAVDGLTVKAKHFRWIVWGGFFAGVLGSIFTHLGGPGRFASEGSVLAERQSWLMPLAYALVPVALVIKTKRGGQLLNVALFLATLALVALTGFRSRMVEFSFVAILFWFFTSKRKNAYIVSLIAFGLVCYVLLLSISASLPETAQRAISFVPGVQVSERIADDAAGSIEWRVEIWQYCLERAKEFLVIGRGSAFGLDETLEQIGVADRGRLTPWIAFLTRNYHSGPLALIIDYGLPGFIAAFWLTVLVLKRVGSYIARLGKMDDSFEARFVLYLCVHQIWYWVSFYLVYGSMRKFSENLTGVAVLMVLMASLLSIEAQKMDALNLAEEAVDLPNVAEIASRRLRK
jgi:hypothetical protein